MALSAKLQFRQSQSLVMTPQLMQSIRLLQFSSLELAAYVDREVEKNPLLSLDETGESPGPTPNDDENRQENTDSEAEIANMADDGDWIGAELETSTAAVEEKLGTSLENEFEPDMTGQPAAGESLQSSDPWQATSQTLSLEDAGPNLEEYCAIEPTLRDHLLEQLPLAIRDPAELLIAREIIESLDDDGYLRRPIEELATTLGADVGLVNTVLGKVQSFEPSGVAARDLEECLAIQLKEKDRFDPPMQVLTQNLDVLAKRDFTLLCRICGVDRDDIADMVHEIRELEPRPGRRFNPSPVQPAIADIFVKQGSDGGWQVELNPETLPKVLVNRDYYSKISKTCQGETEKTFVMDCLQSANWLVKSLDQRAQTILKVASEIVKQQDMFLAYGVEHLKPLNLKMVADAIKMHESTVSRVTSNKYMMTDRGLFELKYFFTASIAATEGEEAHSAEAVRHRIRQLVDAEQPEKILSDDVIVKMLRSSGIDIARRTVAKYRESLNIPSSVQRRREKRGLMA
ncbi:MAG: RNA polymerase factor sigma-54 [Pseudomonadota bacterium]